MREITGHKDVQYIRTILSRKWVWLSGASDVLRVEIRCHDGGIVELGWKTLPIVFPKGPTKVVVISNHPEGAPDAFEISRQRWYL